MLRPAAHRGLYSIRPSFGSASLDGLKINAPDYDTVGLFGRSIDDLYTLAEETLDVISTKRSIADPVRLLYPLDFFPLPDPTHQSLMEEFIGVLEDFLVSILHPFHLERPTL